MQDRDADLAIGIDVRVPHFALELHYWRTIRVVIGELESCLEVATFIEGLVRAFENNVPQEEIIVVLKADACTELIVLLDISQLLGEYVHRVLLGVGFHDNELFEL